MEQSELFSSRDQSLTVSEITIKLRDLIESERTFQSLWVQGEVSNFSQPQSGHLYFTLKDSGAELRAVMWRGMAANQAYIPAEGEAVEVHGSISVYEARGQYQLYADEIRPAGEGALYRQFIELKDRLEKEGLFDAEHKQAIPTRPGTIGVVTSPTGAALRDMLNTLARRYPMANVILAPAAVQGTQAPKELRAALKSLTAQAPDVIIMGRGGGSIEDLAAFNDEDLARDIFASSIPVISGVGHETDFSISDFVADLRAPTPTAAAELATPSQDELQAEIVETFGRLNSAIGERLQTRRWTLQEQQHALARRSPQTRIGNEFQRVSQQNQELIHAFNQGFSRRGSRLQEHLARLNALNPSMVLERGYSIVSDAAGELLSKQAQAKAGKDIVIDVQDGRYKAQIKEKE